MNRYQGRRFAGFCITAGLLMAGLYFSPEHYGQFANVLGLVYSVYLGGQSVTDWKTAANGQT